MKITTQPVITAIPVGKFKPGQVYNVGGVLFMPSIPPVTSLPALIEISNLETGRQACMDSGSMRIPLNIQEVIVSAGG